MSKPSSNFSPIQMFLMFVGILILGIIFRRLGFLLFIALVVIVFLVSMYFFIKYFRALRKNKKFEESVQGSIAQNLKLCKEQIKKNEKEMIGINKSIIELKSKMEDKNQINEKTMNEGDILIRGFERELDLRKAKLDFYQICQEKLVKIELNQKLVEDIATKREKLKKLQEEHFDDLAEMEQLRSDMEYNKSFLETINNLSMRMAESTSLSTAQELHNELKLITKELRDL